MSCTEVNWRIRAKGDARRRRVTIDRSLGGVPLGLEITKAWLTARSEIGGTIIFQKEITTTNVAGIGHIENNGAGDVDFVVRFDLLRADTLLLPVTTKESFDRYHYDVQVLATDLNPYTAEVGRVSCCFDEVTEVAA
jgi:hypothetical protein